ncbi:MAG TPA: ATP-binding protein, partial [Ideonella sp.]|nr:ATP-binding protein [Ideonella sp.]
LADAALADAAEQREAAAAFAPPPALVQLAGRFGLSAFERDTLLLCAAVELDPELGALIARCPGQGGRSAPSFALALDLFADTSWEALAPHRPLRQARLLEINQPGATPLTAASLRADERIVHYLKGLNVLDERLDQLLAPVDTADPPRLAPSQQAVAEALLLQLALTQARLPLVQLLGIDAGSKLELAREMCAELHCDLYRLAFDALPTHQAEADALVRLWQRERLLLPIALYLDAEEAQGAPHEAAAAFQAFVARDIGLAFVGLREPLARTVGEALSFEVAKPTAQEQHQAWLEALGASPSADSTTGAAPLLAGHFDLGLREIHQAVARAAATHPRQLQPDDLWQACRQLTQPRLDQLAQRLDPKATWDDLVLADEASALLRQIAQQVRHRYRVFEDWGYAKRMNRGMGISALFAGESGTGKTMAAEVIANELRLSLYRIDLSAVVSKYIGETEKNLRRLFDAAEQGGAILFFDEADALFGKRSEVKDSHDRYANIEINYLLQRMEAFSGLAILATNMKPALDTAFLRRLRFVVNFRYPGPAERLQMWRQAMPPDLPREALDLERLARFNLSGGNIHSVVLNAAFMAAARGTPLTQPLLMNALRSELRKLEKPVNEAEFR